MRFSAGISGIDGGLDTGLLDISQEIDEYIEKFTSLYTGNASGDMDTRMIIEEKDFPSDNENGAVLIEYSDLSGKCLRYELHYYGETGNTIINYYNCENFIWVSRQNNHYSSWIMIPEHQNVLYSEVDDWIIEDGKAYIIHDNGELEEAENTDTEYLLRTYKEIQKNDLTDNIVLQGSKIIIDFRQLQFHISLNNYLGPDEQTSYSKYIKLGELLSPDDYSDYEKYLNFQDKENVRCIYSYESDTSDISIEQAMTLCADILAELNPEMVMEEVMAEDKWGYVGYKFNRREMGEQIIENKIGTREPISFDGIQLMVYLYEDIIDDAETGEGHTATTAVFHIFLRDRILILEE